MAAMFPSMPIVCDWFPAVRVSWVHRHLGVGGVRRWAHPAQDDWQVDEAVEQPK